MGANHPLQGFYTAIVTPFDTAGSLDLERLPALMEFQAAAGMDGLVVAGTNGEGTSLSVEERKALLEAALRHRGTLRIVASTGAASVTDAVTLSRHAESVGAEALLVLPPFYYKSPLIEGLDRYFSAVLSSTTLPTLLYHIPQFTAVEISIELIEKLMAHRTLAGVKDSAGDWAHTSCLIERFPKLSIFAGSDLLAARSLQAGSAGSISGGANAFPELLAAIRDAYGSGDLSALEAAQDRVCRVAEITRRYPPVVVNKSILAHRGLPRLYSRAPLVDLTQEREAELLGELRAIGVL